MIPNSRRPDVPINLPDNFYDEVNKLQRKLLLFRLQNHSRVVLNPSVYDPNLEDRYNQILILLLSIVSDAVVKDQIKSLVLELQDRAVEVRSESLEGKVLKALIIEIIWALPGVLPFVKSVTERVKVITGLDKLTSKKVGGILRGMGFRTKQNPSSKLYHVEMDEVDKERLEGLKKRYGLSEDEIFKNHGISEDKKKD